MGSSSSSSSHHGSSNGDGHVAFFFGEETPSSMAAAALLSPIMDASRERYHFSNSQHLKLEDKCLKAKFADKNCLLKNPDGSLIVMGFDGSLGSCRKSLPSRPIGMDVQHGVAIQRRGSVYHNSREVTNKLQDPRSKPKLSQIKEEFLSFDIVNSSSLSFQDDCRSSGQKKKLPVTPSDKNPKSETLEPAGTVTASSQDFLALSLHVHLQEQLAASLDSCTSKENTSDDLLEIRSDANLPCCLEESPGSAKEGGVESSRLTYSEQLCPENAGNILPKSEKRYFLPKSLSAKLGRVSSLNQTIGETLRDSLKSRSGSCRRILDPITKSKSQRNSLLSEAVHKIQASDTDSLRKRVFRKCLLNDFSKVPNRLQKTDNEGLYVMKDHEAPVPLSPIHLAGILKLEKRYACTSIEFFLKDSEDVLSAKVWRTTSALNWVYTFHRSKKKTSNSGWMKDRCKQSPAFIGQMQASRYLYSKISRKQSLNCSAVMEFVLYDIAQARMSSAGEERSCTSVEASSQPSTTTGNANSKTANSRVKNNLTNSEKYKHLSINALGNGDLEASDSEPWAPADLSPYLEIAAIVIQLPYNNKEILENMKLDEAHTKKSSSLSSVPVVNQDTRTVSQSLHSADMKVITPSSGHGLPCKEGCPSALIDRWRSGGACDCGGWDVGCPIVVFDHDNCELAADGRRNESLKLFIQGKKDANPAFTMSILEEGRYSVHFHAKFSPLQAFSICVATLHALRPSLIVGQDVKSPKLHSKSLKLLLENEVWQLMGAVAEKENTKAKKGVVHSTLEIPVSPIGRV